MGTHTRFSGSRRIGDKNATNIFNDPQRLSDAELLRRPEPGIAKIQLAFKVTGGPFPFKQFCTSSCKRFLPGDNPQQLFEKGK